MAIVYLQTVGSQRPLFLEGKFEFSRVPSIGEIIRIPDKESPGNDLHWFKVAEVTHFTRIDNPAFQVDAELFGEVMTEEACDLIYRLG